MRDPLGIVPADIRERYEREELVDRQVRAARSLERELKAAFGDEIELVRVSPRIPEHKRPESAIPGYWHVRRNNPPPAVPTYIPITTPDGGYREPDGWVVRELAEIDLRRPGVRERIMDRSRNDSPHKQKERNLRKEQRHDQLKEDFRAAKRVPGEGGLVKKKAYAKKTA